MLLPQLRHLYEVSAVGCDPLGWLARPSAEGVRSPDALRPG